MSLELVDTPKELVEEYGRIVETYYCQECERKVE